MNEYESAVAAARVASRENLLAKYRRDLAAALDERDEALVRLSFLKQSEDTTGRALANCLVALEDMTLERDQAEAALQECSVDERNWNRERDRLETELEHAQNTVARLVEERDAAQAELRKHYGQRGPTCVKWLAEGGMREVLDILSQPHPVNVSEAAAAHLERGLGTNMIWARQVVAQINAWWQDAREAE